MLSRYAVDAIFQVRQYAHSDIVLVVSAVQNFTYNLQGKRLLARCPVSLVSERFGPTYGLHEIQQLARRLIRASSMRIRSTYLLQSKQ